MASQAECRRFDPGLPLQTQATIGPQLALIALLLLAAVPAMGQTVSVPSEKCLPWAETLRDEVKAFPADWKIIVVCDARTWKQIEKHVTLGPVPGITLAFTNLQAKKTFLNPTLFKERSHLRKATLAHEMEHIRCNCSLGE